jgi:methionyl-tRNA formyltransferase
LLKKEDGFFSMNEKTPTEVEKLVRAMLPWPGAWTLIRLSAADEKKKRLKLLKAHLEETKLVIDEVQLEGKDPVTWKQFKEGYKTMQFV